MLSSKIRILIIDDSSTTRKVVKKYLNELGYRNVTEADDGKSGLDVLRGANPPIGLIISDWHMKDKSGLELLKDIRRDRKFNDIPIIFASAERKGEKIKEAIQAGVTDYLIKPFTKEQLKHKLSKFVGAGDSGDADLEMAESIKYDKK